MLVIIKAPISVRVRYGSRASGWRVRIWVSGFRVEGAGVWDLPKSHSPASLLRGSWDLVSTLSGVISNYKYSYLSYKPSY